jgi:uncharacterized protein YkwD
MDELSTLSTTTNDRSKYRPMSILSTITSDLSSTSITRSSRIINHRQTIIPVPKITTIHETLETSQEEETTSPSNQINDKSDMDLSLEEFQRQALIEHNAMRTMYRKSPLKLSESLNIYAQVKHNIHLFVFFVSFVIVLG